MMDWVRIRPTCFRIAMGGVFFLVGFHGGEAETPVLRVYNWSEYIDIDPSVPEDRPIVDRSPTLSSFVRTHHCQLEYYEYEDEALMREKIFGQPGFFDLVCMSLSDFKMFLEADQLEKIPIEKVPNRINLIPKMASVEFDPRGDFFIPHLVGTEGIAYRKDLVGKEVTTWKDYFNPPETLKGKVGGLNSAETMIAASLLALGYTGNETQPTVVKDAARNLLELKRKGFLAFITSDIDEIQAKLLSGEMAMTVLYSGDALAAADEDPDGLVKYSIPHEGATLFMDNWVVMKNSQQKELAFQFLNHLLVPEIHAANAAFCRCICPNQAATEVMKAKFPEILENPSIYPPENVMEKLEFNWGSDVATLNRLWKRIIE